MAAAVLLGFPRPVQGMEFGAGGERLAGEVLGLGLLFDEQDDESGTAKAGVVVEVVHLGGAVVVPQCQSDGHAALGDGDLVGRGAAVSANEGRKGLV